MSHVVAYLVLPEPVSQLGKGLAWSLDGEAIQRGDGTTFALTEEVLLLLEGFAQMRPPVAFGYLVLALGLLRGRCGPPPGTSAAVDLLRATFQATGRSERNAGAFLGHLLNDVPSWPDAPTVWEVWRRAVLTAADPVRLATETLPSPPLPMPPEELLRLIERRLAAYSRDDLTAWLRTGTGPERTAGEQLVQALRARPVHSLEGFLGDQAERPRLSGALPLVEQLGAALTLPPRRLLDQGLPLGGYSDVTTHGKIDQLLLSQFALDEVEFLRRLAERELLYYRREQPRAEVREELVVVLDQGVRTWGTARLVLLAATFALARLALGRKHVFRIATTGRPEPWGLDDLAPEELAHRLETSDLSEHPGVALTATLADAVTMPRDVVVLTHPRGLDEPAVRTATATVPAGVRLFALSADREGHASLGEFQHGRCVPLREFRVDLTARRTRPVPAGQAARPADWSGPVDPNPCRFFIHPGPGEPTLFAFDAAERHLLMALADGALMLVPLHGRAEMLPRAFVAGGILRMVQWVQGIAGGFLVAGVCGDQNVIARYHLAGRHAEAWVLGKAQTTKFWWYVRDQDCVVQHLYDRLIAVDLQTGEQRQLSQEAAATDTSRIDIALRDVREGWHGCSGGWLNVSPIEKPWNRRMIGLDAATGGVRVRPGDIHPYEFCPQTDGEPTLRGGQLALAWGQQDILALRVNLPSMGERHAGWHLHLYRVPTGQLLLAVPDSSGCWTLSPQGNFVAFEVAPGQAEIRSTQPGSTRKQVTPRARGQASPRLCLGHGWLLIENGSGRHLLRWNRHALRVEPRLYGDAFTSALTSEGLSDMNATPTDKRPAFLAHDLARYRQVFLAKIVAVVDTIGVVTLFDVTGNVVAQVYARGETWAVATPDGHRLGNAGLLGQPATADAAVAIAERLRAAEQLGPETWS